MGEFHSLLRRQLKRVFGHLDAAPPEVRPLLEAVDEAYREFDDDRALLERSLDLSSQELLQANANMVALFRAVPDRFYRLDAAGRVLDHRGGRAGGGERPQVGRTFRQLLPPSAAPDFDAAIEKAQRQRVIASFEYVASVDGTEVTWEARVVPLMDDQVILIVRDISDRRRAEAGIAALARVGREVAATLDLERVAQQIASAVVTLLQARQSALYRLDPASGALVCIGSAGDAGARQWVGRALRRGEGVAGRAVLQRQVVASSYFLRDPGITVPRWLEQRAEDEGFGSVMAVPLVTRDRVIGALALADTEGRTYTDHERQLLIGLGDQAAIAIENARLFEESDRRRRAAEALTEVGRLVSASLEPGEVAEQVVQALHRLLPCRMVVLYRLEPEAGDLALVAGVGAEVDWNRRLARGTATVGRAIEQRRPIVTADVLSDPGIALEAEARVRIERSGYRAVLAVPLVARERVVGALGVGDVLGRVFDAEDVELAQAFADQAALALANAELYAQTRTRLVRMRRVAELSHLVSSSLDLQHVLDSVTEAALDLLHGDLARLWVVDRETARLRVVAVRSADGVVPPELATLELPLSQGLVGWVVREKRLRYSPNLAEEPLLANAPWLQRPGYASLLAVPLVAGDVAVGALVVLTRTTRSFSEEEMELLQVFAAKAATALANANLYREAREAYDQLSHAQEMLAQAQKMEAVGRLAGGVAHDFNNILTVITGRCESLLDALPSIDPARGEIELIANAADRAAALTRQLLAFSRRQVLERRVVNVNTVVTGVVRMLHRLIGENIEIETTLTPEPAYVRADPGQLEQVLLNLAINARDAMPTGGRLAITTTAVVLDQELEAADARIVPGPWIVLSVADTGQGIDPETQRRLFEPFFTTKEVGRGTGLGLATVYGIVRQHDGRIVVESAPGQGARFTIYLPRVEAEAQAGAPRGAPGPRGTERVLLVEDEPQVRALVRHILEAHGYRVLDAEGGAEALRIATEIPIDLIVTDLVMPGMSGREVADAVRRLQPAVRTLYISGYTDDVVGHFSELERPDSAFVEKPFTGRFFAGKVRELLDRT